MARFGEEIDQYSFLGDIPCAWLQRWRQHLSIRAYSSRYRRRSRDLDSRVKRFNSGFSILTTNIKAKCIVYTEQGCKVLVECIPSPLRKLSPCSPLFCYNLVITFCYLQMNCTTRWACYIFIYENKLRRSIANKLRETIHSSRCV